MNNKISQLGNVLLPEAYVAMPLTSASKTVPPGPSGDKSRDVDAESLAGASPAESFVSGSVRSKGKGFL